VKYALFPALAVFLFSSSLVLADPQPGTPGNSGDHNPHGSPPGQGGTAPGSSGDTNPHGTPPGQRITTPTDPAPSGTSGMSPQPVPGFSSPHSSVNPLFECPPRCADGDRADVREAAEAARFLATVKGWEPRWADMAESLDGVAVTVRTTGTWGSERRSWVVRWAKGGGRERGWESTPDGDTHEWVLEGEAQWSRWGTQPWRRGSVGPRRRLAEIPWPRAAVIGSLWEATPVEMTRKPWGRVLVQFVRHRGQGRMTWEVEEASRLLTRVRVLDVQERTAWEETRTYQVLFGRDLLVARRRVVPGGEVAETIAWASQSGPVPPAEAP